MKKPSLGAALKQATQQPERVAPAVRVAERAGKTSAAPPSRVGKKAITAFFDPAVSKQLKQLGLERDATVQDLMREALNDLFQKHGRPPIA
jgi:hypothetical protein